MIDITGGLEMDISSIIQQAPEVADDWRQLRETDACNIHRFPDDGVVRCRDLLLFLNTRIFFTDGIGHDSWLVAFRNNLGRTLAFLIELNMIHRIQTMTEEEATHIEAQPIYGPTGKRRCNRGIHTKRRWINKMITQKGSDNAIVDACVSGHKGYAAVVAALRSSLYLEDARRSLSDTPSAAFHWDESCYSGHSVNVSTVMCCGTQFASHLKPVVA